MSNTLLCVTFSRLAMFVNVPSVVARASKKAHFHLRSVKPRPRPILNTHDQALVTQLRQAGVCTTTLDRFGLLGTSSMLAIADQLSEELSHRELSKCQGERSTLSHSIGFSSRKLLAYPNLFLWGIQPRLLHIAEYYLRQPAAYLGCILRREIPNQKQTGVRLWHKDGEDYKVIKLIIYLNDVGENEGPFEYIPKRHTPSYTQFKHVNNSIHDRAMAQVVSPNQWKRCLGPRGTVMLADTVSVFHHASIPRKDRYSLTLAYTSRNPKNGAKCRRWCPYEESNDWLNIQTMLSAQERQALIGWR